MGKKRKAPESSESPVPSPPPVRRRTRSQKGKQPAESSSSDDSVEEYIPRVTKVPIAPSPQLVTGQRKRRHERQVYSIDELGGHLHSFSATAQTRFNHMCNRQIYSGKYIDDSTLVNLGIKGDVLKYLKEIGWEHLYAFNLPVFTELVIEFLATFEFNLPHEYSVKQPGVVKFRLMGKSYSMSLALFTVHLGQIEFEEFEDVDYEWGALDFTAEFVESFDKFWSEFSTSPAELFYKEMPAKKIKDPALRFLHKFIAMTLSGRKETSNQITKVEFFYLWCMKKGITVNLGFWLAKTFSEIATKKRSLVCAPFITQIAFSVGAIKSLDVSDLLAIGLHEAPPMEPLDLQTLFRMGLVEKEGAGFRLCTPRERQGQKAMAAFTAEVRSSKNKAPGAAAEQGAAEEAPVDEAEGAADSPSEDDATTSRPLGPFIITKLKEISLEQQALHKKLDNLTALVEAYLADINWIPPSRRH